MGERGQIALQREGLVAAATRLERTASALMIDASSRRVSLAGTCSLSLSCLSHTIPQYVPARATSIATGLCGTGLCGYDYPREVIGALPRDGSPNRELLQ
jgi:hypothetical protein